MKLPSSIRIAPPVKRERGEMANSASDQANNEADGQNYQRKTRKLDLLDPLAHSGLLEPLRSIQMRASVMNSSIQFLNIFSFRPWLRTAYAKMLSDLNRRKQAQ